LFTGLLGRMNFVASRFTGQGRIGIQSMCFRWPTAE
jgi:uncharacterized protein (AIM24 family)